MLHIRCLENQMLMRRARTIFLGSRLHFVKNGTLFEAASMCILTEFIVNPTWLALIFKANDGNPLRCNVTLFLSESKIIPQNILMQLNSDYIYLILYEWFLLFCSTSKRTKNLQLSSVCNFCDNSNKYLVNSKGKILRQNITMKRLNILDPLTCV